jgi:hypothetical protein
MDQELAPVITFTQDDANHILQLLHDLPIRHLAIVQEVQRWLAQKFVVPQE